MKASSPKLQAEIRRAIERHAQALLENSHLQWFPDEGPLAWREYKKHHAFWAAGLLDHERAMICANRVGKTIAGAFETNAHLTGLYRHWWPGVQFRYPIKAWACGDTTDTVRDIIQPVLLGEHGEIGTGMIPKNLIVDVLMRRGGGAAVDTVWVRRHDEKDRYRCSVLQFKSYEQGRKAFQGTAMDLIWLDEEPSLDIYSECAVRTMGTRRSRPPGHLMSTFTPLMGMSDVVLKLLPGGKMP